MISFIRSDGEKFDFERYFRIISLDGIGKINSELFSQDRLEGYGSIITGKRIPSRIIKLTGICIHNAINDVSRNAAIRFFNPNYSFKLYIDYKNSGCWIECMVDICDLPSNNIHAPQKISLDLFCSDPLFREANESCVEISEIIPLFGFPIISCGEGFTTGVYRFDRNVWIMNYGHCDTYCKAIVKIKGNASDTVTNFKLSKIDRYGNEISYFKFLKPLVSGDKLTIDFENCVAMLNGENSIQYVDRKSTFFPIDVGGCYLNFDLDSGKSIIDAKIYYNNLFTGV